jgi:MFS family permease
MSSDKFPAMMPAKSGDLRPVQLGWLAAAVFVVAAGYGALLPLLPGWLTGMMPSATATEIARHIGFLSGVYSAGVLVGAPLWGFVADRAGRARILIIGLVGYVASLLLMLIPAMAGLWGIYALRGMTGFFVAAVVPVVSALVADFTPEEQRARRFAWLGAMSLLGFLFGPGLNAVSDWTGSWAGGEALPVVHSAQLVIVLSAVLGAVMMLGLAATLPASRTPETGAQHNPATSTESRTAALWCLSGAVMFVLAAFELGIVLQGQQHASLSSRQVSIMFAECSLVMLGINAFLFFTALMEKVSARSLIGAGLILAMVGLAVLSQHNSDAWMYLGISLTSAGTGLVLPVISYQAAGAKRQKLGAIMGGLAAAAGLGQTLGSASGGWLFGAIAQRSFAWLTLPLVVMLILLVARPGWWSAIPAEFARRSTGGSRS